MRAAQKEETAMSSRMFQSVIMQMKDASDRTMGVIDGEGNVIAATEPSGLGDKWEDAVHRLNAANELVTVTDGKTFKALQSWSCLLYTSSNSGWAILSRLIRVVAMVISRLFSPECTRLPKSTMPVR